MTWQPPPGDDLPPPQTFTYKTIDTINIEADVYFPNGDHQKLPCPMFLYIYGGGWMACSRKYINVPTVHELLQRGFIVTSIDYRLIPEVSFGEQLDDIRSAETWVRDDLPKQTEKFGFKVNPNQVLVGGASAGAHLAMMVPHLWQTPPLAILSVYGPTDFTTVTPRKETIKNLENMPPLTPEIIKAAMYDTVQTWTIPDPSVPVAAARSHLAVDFCRSGGMGEFLAARFTEDYELRKAGSLPHEMIVKILPALLPLTDYPPLIQIMGTNDLASKTEQCTDFADKLQIAGVSCETILIKDAQHGFDEKARVCGEIHRNIVVPAVDFVCQVLEGSGREIVSRGTVMVELPGDAHAPWSS